jgi:hypothetical protein
VQTLKSVFEAGGVQVSTRVVKSAPEEEKASFGKGKSAEIPGLSGDDVMNAKKSSRKILAKVHRNIVELVSNLDHLDEGIVNKQELRDMLIE